MWKYFIFWDKILLWSILSDFFFFWWNMDLLWEHNFLYWLFNGYQFLLLKSSCVSLNIFFRIFSKLHTLLFSSPLKTSGYDSHTYYQILWLTNLHCCWHFQPPGLFPLFPLIAQNFNTCSNITLAFIFWWCIQPWHFCSLNFISPNSCLHLSENLSFIYS